MTRLKPANPVIETERLILRVPDARELEPLLAFFTSERSTFFDGPYSDADAWYKVAAYAGQWALRGNGFYAITLKEGGETVGLAGPYHPSHFAEPELSYLLLKPEFEGKGYTQEACAAVLAHVFDDLGCDTLVSFIDPANVGSLKLAERLGARLDPATAAPYPLCDTYRHVRREGVA